eukprot:scaffold280196_cov30-Tisochrysis_lutea.AAC.3
MCGLVKSSGARPAAERKPNRWARSAPPACNATTSPRMRSASASSSASSTTAQSRLRSASHAEAEKSEAIGTVLVPLDRKRCSVDPNRRKTLSPPTQHPPQPPQLTHLTHPSRP